MDDAIPGEVEEEKVYKGGIEIATGLQGADLRASRALAPVSSPKSAILFKKHRGDCERNGYVLARFALLLLVVVVKTWSWW